MSCSDNSPPIATITNSTILDEEELNNNSVNDNTILETTEDLTIDIASLKKKVNPIKRKTIFEETAPEEPCNHMKRIMIESLKLKTEVSTRTLHPLIFKTASKELKQEKKKGENEDSPLAVSIQPMLGDSFEVVLPSAKHATVYDLKEALSIKFGIPIKRIQLLEPVNGIFLSPDDAFLVDDFGLDNMQVIRFSLKITCGIESPTFIEIYDSENEEEYLSIRSSFDEAPIPIGSDNENDSNEDDLKEILSLLHVKSSEDHLTIDNQKQSSCTPLTSPITGPSTCYKCGKSIRITQRFECKCKHTFCPSHRFYDKHHCIFNYKQKKIESSPSDSKCEKSKEVDSF